MRGRYKLRPLADRTWLRPSGRRASLFTATWGQTVDLLVNEVFALQTEGMLDPVIEIDAAEADFRIDGDLRANAIVASPAVRVSFDSVQGPLMYRCDRYSSGKTMKPWQHNVRAIAMTLEALRAVDRYGATARGEQYTGFRALPAGQGLAPTSMTVGDAYERLAEITTLDVFQVIADPAQAIGLARKLTHPDVNGGDHGRWNVVDEATQVLRRARKVE